jgi:hypothetical protein
MIGLGNYITLEFLYFSTCFDFPKIYLVPHVPYILSPVSMGRAPKRLRDLLLGFIEGGDLLVKISLILFPWMLCLLPRTDRVC